MKRIRMLLGAITASLAAVATASSCESIAGLDGNFQPAPDAGASSDAGDAGADTGPAGCVSATYPDPPGIPDDGNDIGPLTVAVHTIDLGDMGTVPGYDLDHTCTCTGDAGPTCAGRSTMASLYCDAPGGVDNQFAKIVQLLEVGLGADALSSSAFTMKAEAGYWTLIVQVKEYNGEKDDPSVQVALYPCAGLGATPQWNGTDSWPVLETAVDMGAPVYVSDGAYVSDRTLVATVPKVPITFAGAKETLTLTLSGAVLTGQLVQSNGVWRIIQGQLAARFALSDFFQSLSTYRDNNGMPLCTDSGFLYDTAKTSVCNDADILVDPTQPINTPCDALSFGMGFTADPAILGPVVPVPTPTPGCDAGTDPATDSCPP